jgi:hypothetical protein
MVMKKLSVEAYVEGDDETAVKDIFYNLKGFLDAVEGGYKDSPAEHKGITLKVIVKEII